MSASFARDGSDAPGECQTAAGECVIVEARRAIIDEERYAHILQQIAGVEREFREEEDRPPAGSVATVTSEAKGKPVVESSVASVALRAVRMILRAAARGT